MRQLFVRFKRQISWLIGISRDSLLPRVLILVSAMIVLGGLAAYTFERQAAGANIRDLGDAMWWAVVTIATVGYGDRFPVTLGGRLVAIFLMFVGVGILSILTATIASFFVERKLRERMGIESFKLANHHLICGWSPKVRSVLDGFSAEARKSSGRQQVILIHEGDPDTVHALEASYPELSLRFVRGDYTSETILKRANIQGARSIAFLVDEQHLDSSDERNIIAAQLALHLNNNLQICAELRDARHRPHLERLEIDNIVVAGEYDGFVLSNAVVSPGLPNAIHQLLATTSPNAMLEVVIPSHYHGQTFDRLGDHFRKQGAILIGLSRKRSSLSLDDLVAGGDSFIDQFIRRKFQEAEREYFTSKGSTGVVLNPPADERIQEADAAIIIGRA